MPRHRGITQQDGGQLGSTVPSNLVGSFACEAFGVSRTWFHGWLAWPPNAQGRSDEVVDSGQDRDPGLIMAVTLEGSGMSWHDEAGTTRAYVHIPEMTDLIAGRMS